MRCSELSRVAAYIEGGRVGINWTGYVLQRWNRRIWYTALIQSLWILSTLRMNLVDYVGEKIAALHKRVELSREATQDYRLGICVYFIDCYILCARNGLDDESWCVPPLWFWSRNIVLKRRHPRMSCGMQVLYSRDKSAPILHIQTRKLGAQCIMWNSWVFSVYC